MNLIFFDPNKRFFAFVSSLLIYFVAFCSLASSQQNANKTQRARAENLSKPMKPAEPSRPITVRDILSLRQVPEIRISPDGSTAAFLLSESFVERNEVRQAVYLVNLKRNSAPNFLTEATGISNLRWTPDGKTLTFLSAQTGTEQIWKVSTSGRKPQLFISHDKSGIVGGFFQTYGSSYGQRKVSIFRYESSPDGKKLAFLTLKTGGNDARDSGDEGGIVYNDLTMNRRTIHLGAWETPTTDLWIYDTTTRKRKIVKNFSEQIYGLSWSPDSANLAVTRGDGSPSGFKLEIYSTATGNFSTVETKNSPVVSPYWTPGADAIATVFGRNIIFFPLGGAANPSQKPVPSPLGLVKNLWWSKDKNQIAISGTEKKRETAYLINVASGQAQPVISTPDDLSSCDFDSSLKTAVCVRQNVSAPPELVKIILPGNAVEPLLEFNSHFRQIVRAPVREQTWTNKYGNKSDGYVMRPLNHRAGQKYPVVVITHGTDARNKFISQEFQWEYPAQVFAVNGYVVLMVNEPAFVPPQNPDFRKLNAGLNAVASMEAAVESVLEQGVGDPSRVGIMGYSRGSQIVNLAVTQSKTFTAASSGESGVLNAGLYWLAGTKEFRDFNNSIFGGSPFEAKTNWESLSPSLNTEKISVPFLQQFSSLSAHAGLELYSALREKNIPTDLVIYPDESHIFFQPKHRAAAMRLNLDWFDYWLQGKEDPAPEKQEQYARWRKMRDELNKNKKP
jgi:dipeptidyl aminopeptidase/acylaminoacyl peptidase